MHNHQKKIAVINDFCGFGKCSIAVSLPIISAMKIQCCPLPTSLFSNHTGFESFYFNDYTENMQKYIDIVINQLELLRPVIVIHRITGDPKLEDLIEPNWLVKKFCVLNDIDKEMVKRDVYQGDKIKED